MPSGADHPGNRLVARRVVGKRTEYPNSSLLKMETAALAPQTTPRTVVKPIVPLPMVAATSPGSSASAAARPSTAEVERIFIPAIDRGRAIADFAASVRLGHLFQDANVRLVGNLHGRSYVELGKYRNCGRETLDELRELVRRLQAGACKVIPAEGSAEIENPHLLLVARKRAS
jgi:hypothetical protein